MRDIDDQEWKAYVTKCTTGEWPVPPSFVSDKNNWLCRAIVGRVLYFIKDVEGALTVLSTFINDVEPDMDDHPDQGMCEAEHFVLSLRDISEIIWKLTKNGDAALQYLDRAFKICRKFPYRFHTEARGDIWYRRNLPEISLPVSHGSPGRYLVPAAEHSGGKRQNGTGCCRGGRDGDK